MSNVRTRQGRAAVSFGPLLALAALHGAGCQSDGVVADPGEAQHEVHAERTSNDAVLAQHAASTHDDAVPVHAAQQVHDHCLHGEVPDARDATLANEPEQWRGSSGQVDLLVPKDVVAWMAERYWEPAHDAWHNVRRCVSGGGGLRRSAECNVPELVNAHRECSDAANGYDFLAAHRHMIEGIKQAFPRHAALFAPFPAFPFDATDVPEVYRGRFGSGWSATIKDAAKVLENIEANLARFPTDGDLGRFIQCNAGASGSVHGAMHFKWAVNGSPGNLGNQANNLKNHMFWKLHGWIDQIWERYRVAKKLGKDEPTYAKSMIDQCREMDKLGRYKKGLPPPVVPVQPSGAQRAERGVFHEKVRPILEQYCAACHSETSPEAALSLGGALSSADIVKNLVSVRSVHGGQFARVVPGAPDQSWLFLKVSGKSLTTTCVGADCNRQVMPPTGEVTLTTAELSVIRAWIADGAPAPTIATP